MVDNFYMLLPFPFARERGGREEGREREKERERERERDPITL